MIRADPKVHDVEDAFASDKEFYRIAIVIRLVEPIVAFEISRFVGSLTSLRKECSFKHERVP